MDNIFYFKNPLFKNFVEKNQVSFFIFFVVFIEIFIFCTKDFHAKRIKALTDKDHIYSNINKTINISKRILTSKFSDYYKRRRSESNVISIHRDLDYVNSINL